MIVLTDGNFVDYLKEIYDNPCAEEFKEDLSRIKYIKKLITRYIDYGKDELRERLILNHIIILVNVFGIEATVRCLFLKLPLMIPYIKPFLVLLDIMPDKIFNIKKECVIDTNDYLMDSYIVEALRKI